MKKIILGLTPLVASSCLKPIDERASDMVVKECNTINNNRGISILTNLDLPAEGEYLTPPQMVHVDKVLQEKTDCHLSVYFDREEGDRTYVVQKNYSTLVPYAYYPRYVRLYPLVI